ncbi:hypothetical protein LOZ66_000620 [Ophidiomyces ophidiicola]|nr:hypothetical protein LOZ66_000620 [Ophidiomyces ophidiicola]
MAAPIVLKGGCACSKIRYTSTAMPEWVHNCLCITCRKASGAPYQTFAGYFLRSAVTWTTEPPKYYRSSDFAKRGFCDECGSSLTFEMDAFPDNISLAAGSFDDWDIVGGHNALTKPEGYIYVKQKPVWFDLPNDGLERFEELPPEAQAEKDSQAQAK